MRKLLKPAWALVEENKRIYLALNVTCYALVVVCMIYVAFDTELQQSLLEDVGAGFSAGGPLAFVGEAYVDARIIAAILATFFVTLFVGAAVSITLPSLIIPFSGLLVGAYRAILWGLLLSPADPDLRLIMIPHSITLVLEGQAYILAMLAAAIQGRTFLWPRAAGLESRVKGYVEGLKRTGRLYLLILLTLGIAAIYEVIEVVVMIQFLG